MKTMLERWNVDNLRPVLGLALILILLSGPGIGCRKAPPSVLLVSIDSLRYDDAFGSASGVRIAPTLDRLGREGVFYSRAYTTAPWTTPAMMAVMTGLNPLAHGVEEHDRALASSVPLLAQRFQKAGYHTAAFVPEITLRPEFGFARGFDQYDLQQFGHQLISSPTLIGKVQNLLETSRKSDQPLFIWVHLWDPHYNFNPPPPFDQKFREGTAPPSQDVQCLKWQPNAVSPDGARFLRGQYRGEIAFTDRVIGELLDYLKQQKLDEKTLLVVLGDHGEAFQEHGWLGHTNRVDEELLHVPLMLRWPGHLSPAEVTQQVSTDQVGRTILDLAGLESTGFGTAAVLPRSPSAPSAQPILVAETLRQNCLTALREGQEKYVLEQRGCVEQLFDLKADPGEAHNLAASRPERVRFFRGLLRGEVDRISALAIPRGALPQGIGGEAEQALRDLGYVGSRTAGPGPGGCVFAPATGRRDTFGDTEVDSCPDRGLEACLKAWGR